MKEENNWREWALHLAHKGYSWRKIARTLDVPKSTVSDYLRKQFRGSTRTQKVEGYIPLGDDIKTSCTASSGLSGAYTGSKDVGRRHLVIADTQVKPKHDLTYLAAIGRYIGDSKPDVIIHIGDHFDMESLSSYDRGKRSFEGRRVKSDLDAGYQGMDLLIENAGVGKGGWFPEMVFCLGNHEERIDRFSSDNPEFEGFLGTELLDLEQYGWNVIPFLKPKIIDGISYVHYLANPFSGRPYGGSALHQLKNVGNSFVVGHKQTLDVAIRPTLSGKMQLGIINGACYPHHEEYKGYQGNYHFRGLTVLNEVKDGYGDVMMVSLDYIMRKYS